MTKSLKFFKPTQATAWPTVKTPSRHHEDAAPLSVGGVRTGGLAEILSDIVRAQVPSSILVEIGVVEGSAGYIKAIQRVIGVLDVYVDAF